ncbi:pentatricopeptide repeat-containing protein At5g27110 [Euphorbia lathyris]|uniref:pentatricopeptide repeat-containing protein At5g27110 n=1 Tax=Euphorbia lathyris TaxID=212925 RepID=UPI0033138D6A
MEILFSSLRKCVSSKSLMLGKLIHQKMVTSGLQNNIPLCKNLIDLYFSCQYFDYAKLVFKRIENPLDISLWNAIIAAYTRNHMYIEAFQIYQSLLQYPYLNPDSFTYPSVLKACAGLGKHYYGKLLHSRLLKSGLLFDIVVRSSLVGLYAKCSSFDYAIQVFDEMPDRDVASWNTIISCYYQDGKAQKALELYGKMRESGFEPNSVTLTVVISSCARLLDLERGKEIHREILTNGIILDSFISSALVDMYGKCGCLDTAKGIFEQMPKKTLVAWNSLIAGYSSVGDTKECIDLFMRMEKGVIKANLTTISSMLLACSRAAELQVGRLIHGYVIRNRMKPDIFVISGLIDLYFKCGRVLSAENVFKMMPKASVVCWNVMISGYITVGNYVDALGMYNGMKLAGVKPDAVTFSSILSACSHLAALEKGKEIHNCLTEAGFETNEVVMGALLDMYAKCGAVNEALAVFHKLPERDIVSWTCMITAYGSHGQALRALRLFDEMQLSNAKPDVITFLAVLSACSHGGLVDKGCYYFNLMSDKYGIKPRTEHYSCLIDLLGRAGRLWEAYSILQNTPEITEDVGLLSTLFSACHLQKEFKLGEEIAELLIKKDVEDSSTYITLSNMYAFEKDWEKVRMVRLKMKKLGLKKNPGCSWIEIDKRIQPFFVEDQSHAQAEMLNHCLSILTSHMEKDECCHHNIHIESI